MPTQRPASGDGPAPAPRARCWPQPLHLHLAMMALASADTGSDVLAEALEGLAAYQRHPYRRDQQERPVLASEGGSRLLDYGGTGVPALFVPSLVNPATILDLLPERSLLAHAATNGIRPLLLDWGSPGAAEAGFDLAAYVGRLARLIGQAATLMGGPVALVGYCMGGTLAVAASLLAREAVSRLALLAAPWDFHAGPGTHYALALAAAPLLPLIEQAGTVPMALAQGFFLALHPRAALDKFARFRRLDLDDAEARFFVALEDWVNGGAPLAGAMAAATLRDWYLFNLPAQGLWRVADRRVTPGDLRPPVFAAVPRADRIVPPESALGVCRGLVPERLIRPPSGHVGMIIGRRARTQLWDPLVAWLREGV